MLSEKKTNSYTKILESVGRPDDNLISQARNQKLSAFTGFSNALNPKFFALKILTFMIASHTI